MKWNYLYKDEIIFPNKNDYRNGQYLVYEKDTYKRIINNKHWDDEREYLCDYVERTLESVDGKLIYVPDSEVASRLELIDAINDAEWREEFYL